MNRRGTVLAILALGLAPRVSLAQPTSKVWRIGYLSSESPGPKAIRFKAVQQGFRDLGYVEGKDLVIETRWAQGAYDKLRGLADELVRLKVDAIVTEGEKAGLAAQAATKTIPIVMGIAGDPVGLGLVASLARPGGNITGSSGMNVEMTVKRLEILKETIPNLARVAILLNPANSAAKPILDALRTAAKSLKVELQPVEARTPAEIDIALSAKSIGQAKALVVQSDTLFFANTAKIADLSARRHLPSAGNGPIAEAGGLIGYGPEFGGGFYRAAALVDKILKGAKPADMPIEQPTKFELVVNLKTAKALGLKIPQSVLLRADRVIE